MKFPGVHVAAGVGTVIVFLGTGLYMRMNFPELYEPHEVIRYLFRANHVYLLYSGLLNIGVGVYLSVSEKRWKKTAQDVGSWFLLVAPIVLFWAFVAEPAKASPARPYTLAGVFLCLAGILLHLIGGRGKSHTV